MHELILGSGAFGSLLQKEGELVWTLAGMQNPVIDVQAIREAMSAINKATHSSRTSLLLDLRCEGVMMFTPTAKAALLGHDFVKMRTAMAFVCTEVTRKTVFMHLVSFNKFNLPIKAFSNEEEAMTWLKGFLPN